MFQVTRLQDGIFEVPADALLYVGDEAKSAALRAEKAGATTPIPVNCFLLRNGDEVMLVDSGAGSAWGPGLGHAREALAAANVAPDAIRRVILTHIHGDHVLGLFEGDTAYFPHARILLPAAEYDFFLDAAARAAAPEGMRDTIELADKLSSVYAHRIDTFEGTEALPGITAVPMPGHTHGHTGYRVETPEGPVLLWGDALHMRAIQPGDPKIGLNFDDDSEQALQTRLAALALAADEGLRVGGGHLDGLFRVVRDGAHFRMEE